MAQKNYNEMEQLSVEEGNRIIAEFMGAKFNPEFPTIVYDMPVHYIDEIKFHSSWDWLYPVFQKLMTLKFVTSQRLHWARRIGPVRKYFGDGESIEVIFPAIVKAIQWYQTQNKQQP